MDWRHKNQVPNEPFYYEHTFISVTIIMTLCPKDAYSILHFIAKQISWDLIRQPIKCLCTVSIKVYAKLVKSRYTLYQIYY